MEIKTVMLNEKDEAYALHYVSLPANLPVLNPLPLPLPLPLPRLPAL